MILIQLSLEDKQYIKEAAELLREAFPDSYSDSAEEEILSCLQEEKVLIGAIENSHLTGFVGAIPQYPAAWELHPLIVSSSHRFKGTGSKLCRELEEILRPKGCLTIYLGSDDETGSTTLGNTNLFEDTKNKKHKEPEKPSLRVLPEDGIFHRRSHPRCQRKGKTGYLDGKEYFPTGE